MTLLLFFIVIPAILPALLQVGRVLNMEPFGLLKKDLL